MLTPRIKKIIIITVFVLIVLAMAWLLYTLFFKPAPPVVVNNQVNNQVPTNGLPDVGNDVANRQVTNDTNQPGSVPTIPSPTRQNNLARDVEPVTSTTAQNVSSTESGEISYYDPDEGLFYRYYNGQLSPLSDKVFYDVENVTWSKQGDRAVIEYPDGYNILYDFKRQQQISLPKQMEDFSFDQSGENIAAKVITDNPDNNWLVTANYDGSGIQFIEHFGEKSNDVQVNWSPAGEIVATYRESVDFERMEVFPIGKSGGNIKSLIVDGRGFEGQWSPEGDYILYSVYNTDSGYRPTLYLSDLGGDTSGSNKVRVNLNTWTDKCTFNNSGNKVYCAVPDSLPELSGLYPELTEQSSDSFYEVNLQTGSKRLIAVPGNDSAVRATDLIVSDDGTELFFINKNTNQLEKIQL